MDMRPMIFQLSTSTSLIQTREVRAILQLHHGPRSCVLGTEDSSHCSGAARRLLFGILLMILAFRMRNWKGFIAVETAGVDNLTRHINLVAAASQRTA